MLQFFEIFSFLFLGNSKSLIDLNKEYRLVDMQKFGKFKKAFFYKYF